MSRRESGRIGGLAVRIAELSKLVAGWSVLIAGWSVLIGFPLPSSVTAAVAHGWYVQRTEGQWEVVQRAVAHRVSVQEAPAASAGPLSELSFMVGCWRGPAYGGEGVVEERFTPPLGDTMLGTTRYVRDRKVEMFEFHRIHVGEDGVELVPYPRGRESSPFRLVVAAAGRAVFENPDNDFPVRIIYRIHHGETLVARIEGEDGDGAEWSMRRCGTDGEVRGDGESTGQGDSPTDGSVLAGEEVLAGEDVPGRGDAPGDGSYLDTPDDREPGNALGCIPPEIR